MSHWLFPGSFDPVTCAHEALALRAAALCDDLTVAVLQNRDKPADRSLEVRMEWLRRVFEGHPSIRVECFSGALADYAKQIGADALVRAIRDTSDLEYEYPWARLHLAREGVETIFLAPEARWADLSSSQVRQWAALGKDLSGLVPECIRKDVETLFRQG